MAERHLHCRHCRSRQGATDFEVHDTVLIAAACRMFNRTVDGLATHAPESPAGNPHGVAEQWFR